MADNDRISYDNNEQKLYLGTMDTSPTTSYAVEENALITEKQLNRTEKDIRDYLEENVNGKLDNYVAYFPQDKPDIDRLNALNNVFPSNYWPDFEDRIMTILRKINNSGYSNDYYNIYDYALSKGANIYYLQGAAKKGDYGVAIIPEYFRDIDESDVFYQNGTLANYTRVLNAITTTNNNDPYYIAPSSTNTYNLNGIQEKPAVKGLLDTITTNEVYQRNGLRFAALVKTVEASQSPEGGFKPFYMNNEATPTVVFTGTAETEALKMLTEYYPYDYHEFLPTLLQNIKEGDILYNPDTDKAYVVTTDQILGTRDEFRIKTWTYKDSSTNKVFDRANFSEKNNENTLSIFSGSSVTLSTYQNNFIQKYAEGFNRSFNTPPTSDNQVQVTPLPENQVFYITGALSTDSQPGVDLVHYPYGAFAIPCEEVTNFAVPTNIWLYNGQYLLGSNYEGVDISNFVLLCSLNGNNNALAVPKAGDYVYNPYSKEILTIVRDKCISERCALGNNEETYLLEPITHLIIGEYDGIPRSNGTYLRGSGEFRMADYDLNSNLFTIFKNHFNNYIQDNQLIIDNNFISVILDNNLTSLLSIKDITTNNTPSYDWNIDQPAENQANIEKLVENKNNVYLNTYFILPQYIQSNSNNGDLGKILTSSTRTLQLNCVNPGDIISFKGISFEVIDRPRLLSINNDNASDGFVNALVGQDGTEEQIQFLSSIYCYFYNKEKYSYNNTTLQNSYIEVSDNIIKFKTAANTYVTFSEWLQYFGITDSTLLSYANKVSNNFSDLDYYLRILYYRLLTNADRPIFVKVAPINYSVTGKGDKGDKGDPGIDGVDGDTLLSVNASSFEGSLSGTTITFSYGPRNTSSPTYTTVTLYNGQNAAGIKRFNIGTYIFDDYNHNQYKQLALIKDSSTTPPTYYNSYQEIEGDILDIYGKNIPVIWFNDANNYYNFYFQGATSSTLRSEITFGNWLGSGSSGTLQITPYTPAIPNAPDYKLTILGTEYGPTLYNQTSI